MNEATDRRGDPFNNNSSSTNSDGIDRSTDELIRRIYPSLRRFAAIAGSWSSEPDDLVQEALLRTLRSRRLVDLEFPEAYVRRAIVNIASNERRSDIRQDRRLQRVSGGASVNAEDTYPSDLADLYDLPAQSRAVLYLAEVENASHAEIAAMLGITEAHSRTVASRARQVLRARTEGETS